MKKIHANKFLFIVMLGLNAMLYSEADFDCSTHSLKAPFPEKFVRISLEKFHVPKESWDGIVKALDEKGKNVVQIVQNKAAKMNPNPLEKPKQADVIVKLFKETLLEASTDALKQYGITDLAEIQAIVDDIQEQKRLQFSECLRRQLIPISEALQNQKETSQSLSKEQEHETLKK